MKKLTLWLLSVVLVACLAAITASCGGGGGGTGGGNGGGDTSLIGRVLNISTLNAPIPPANVQAGGNSTTSDSTDGSFILDASTGTTSVVVTGDFGANNPYVFNFSFPAATGTTDIGDLWIGPEKVTVHGRVVDATNGNPVANATVRFAGVSAKSNGSGQFDILGVAYDSNATTTFWGIVGSVQATNYFKVDFSAAPNIKDINNVVNVGDLLVSPSNGTVPPPPSNITGRVLPIGGSANTVVTLLESGVPVRQLNLDSTGRYAFWITPGSYTITFTQGALTAPTQSVTLTDPNQIVNVPDVTLTP